MISSAGLLIGLFSFIIWPVIAKNATRLGCFNVTDHGLTESLLESSDAFFNQGNTWCLRHCGERNYTFAGIRRSLTCVCGAFLGEARHTHLHECLAPCHAGQCGQQNTVLVYVLGEDDAVISFTAPSSLSDVSTVNFHQVVILGVAVAGVVLVLSLLIHCCRVSRRRDRLLKLYISRLERGEREKARPPSKLAISNNLCADFFCCCYAESRDDLDCDELLNELDIDPDHRQSFSRKVKEYIRRCEDEKNQNREETKRILRSLARTGSLVTSRRSLRKLAKQYALSRRRTKDQNDGSSHKKLSIPLHGTMSSPGKLCRRMDGSSSSSIGKAFPDYTSNISMHMKSNLQRVYNRGAVDRSFPSSSAKCRGLYEADTSVSQCSSSPCSSNRLIPASFDASNSRLSRKKDMAQSGSYGHHVRMQRSEDESDSEAPESMSESDTDA